MCSAHLPKANITHEVRITSKDTSRSVQAEHIVQKKHPLSADKRCFFLVELTGFEPVISTLPV